MAPGDDAAILVVRVPKSGSTSLSLMAEQAFAGRRFHYVPDTLRREADFSWWQALRHRRSQTRNLLKRYKVTTLTAALAKVGKTIQPGDVLAGGHSDFATIAAHLPLPVRFLTILREPGARALSDYNYARRNYLRRRPWQRFDSHIVAKIAGRYDFEGFLSFQLEHAPHFRDIACAFIGLAADADLETHLACSLWEWGVLDKGEILAERVSARVGRRVSLPRENVTAGTGEAAITAAQRRLIERLYARDLELYARAGER